MKKTKLIAIILCMVIAFAFAGCTGAGTTDFTSIQAEIDRLKDKVSDLETDNASLKDKVSDLETDNASLKDKVSDLETDNASLKDKVSDLETELATKGFYTDKAEYTIEEIISVYYNGTKLYDLRFVNFNSLQVATLSINLALTVYYNAALFAPIADSIQLEWDGGAIANTFGYSSSSKIVKNEEKTFSAFFTSETAFIGGGSSFYNLVVVVPGTDIPLARMTGIPTSAVTP